MALSRLTKSQENYLRTIYILSSQERAVRITDIASSFGVTKASASIAVTRLEKDGLVVRDSNRLISLTPDGEREARRVFENFTLINLFLTSKLKVDSNIALIDAGALEHVVSEETVDALRSFMK
jgi:DtxR family Mn-dependent transcriptional regulator